MVADPARVRADERGLSESPAPRPRSYLRFAVLLGALAMVSPFSIDTFFPSFHAMAAEFQLTPWEIQQTLSVYMVPLAFMSLIQGPLSDSIGRRPVVVTGLVLYSLASLGCTAAPNFATLLVFRAIQGMTAGVGTIVGRAVIRDLHEGPQAQKLMSLVVMIFAFAPAVAPIIGGWIHVTFGWRAVFGFMVTIGAVLALSSFLGLPETHPKSRRVPLHARELTRTAWGVVRNREFLTLAVAMGANFAAMMCFIGAAPAVIVDHWHLRETQFAWLFAPVIGGFVVGAWISGRMAGRVRGTTQAELGFVIALAGAGALLALLLGTRSVPIPVQQALLATIAFGVQLVLPVLSLRMLDLYPRARGAAASVQSFVSILISALVFGQLSPLLNGSMHTLAAGSFVAALLGFALWRRARLSSGA
jgi:DHA1 family bicyclomycin/chloramphenicol resistance-like MFS transporter